jgi:organic radical activating enzyme
MPEHLGAAGPLRTLGDFSGQDLITRVLALVKRLRPLHISIVGGDPLVRWRELDILLPELAALGVEVQLVTSAFRPIPVKWEALSNIHLVISIVGVRASFEAMVAGKLNCTVECNPLLGPQLFDAVESVKSGKQLPKRIVMDEKVYEQKDAATVIKDRKY